MLQGAQESLKPWDAERLRSSGVRCGDLELEAPVVVNVAGPHSSQITQMALAEHDDMTISTRAMRQET